MEQIYDVFMDPTMPSDTRLRGYLADITRQAARLRSVDALRVLDRIARKLLHWQDDDGPLDLVTVSSTVLPVDAADEALLSICEHIAAEDRDQAEQHERARDEVVHIGQPGDDLGEVAVPVDSDAPAATYVPRIVLATDDTATTPRDPRIRVVVDEGEPPDELGEGG